MANGNLSGRVASGVAWSISEKAGSMLLQAVVSIVVANMLVPLDLGIMAVLTVFTALAQVVVDSGFSQTLIRKANPTDGDYKAVFRFNVITSIVLYALLTALSPVAARYYGWPELARVAPVLFLLLPANALCVIQNTIMVREFRFAQLSAITFAASLASGIVAVVMAVSGCGVWSLVGQRVSMMAVKAALLWIRSPWRPRAACKASSLGEMAPYSLRLMGTDLITALYNNIAPLFIGKIYSGDALGCFNQAQKLKDMPVNSAMQSIQSVTFPALARIGGDETKFAESYRRVVMVTAFAMFPAMAGLIATADDIYALLLKPDWRPAVPYFRILCLTGIFYPLSTIAYNILKVRSDGGIILRLEFVKRAMTTIILIITIPRSVEAVAWGLAASAACEAIVNTLAARRYTSLGIRRTGRTLLPISVLTLFMYVAVVGVAHLTAHWHVALRLATEILSGASIYAAGAYLARMEAFGEVRTIVAELIGKTKRRII